MNNILEIEPINTKAAEEYRGKALDITKQVSIMTIRTQEHYEQAAGFRASMKKMLTEIETSRKSITKPLDVAKAAVMDLFRPAQTALENGIKHADSLIISYQDQKERERREQEEKLRKQAEAEEKKKKEALEERAKKAEASGKAEKAEELRQKAEEVQVVAPILAPTIQKVEGLSFRENWSAEVIDLMSLVKAVAEGKAPLNFLQANQTVLNSQAKATKDAMQFPGVKFKSEKVPVGR